MSMPGPISYGGSHIVIIFVMRMLIVMIMRIIIRANMFRGFTVQF